MEQDRQYLKSRRTASGGVVGASVIVSPVTSWAFSAEIPPLRHRTSLILHRPAGVFSVSLSLSSR